MAWPVNNFQLNSCRWRRNVAGFLNRNQIIRIIMKINVLFSLTLLAASSLLAADSTPKDDVTSAATALGSAANYSWHTTVDAGPNARFRPGPTDGKTEKDGYTTLSMTFNDNTLESVRQGKKVAVKTPDGWQTAEEATQDNGGGFNPIMFAARMAQNARTPAVDAASLAGQAQSLTAGQNGITGDLTEDGAKTLLTLFRRGNNGNGPTVSNAKGTVTFWIADGKLTKIQTHVTGTVSFNGNDRDVDRTTTTEIKDVGTTKIEVPDEAKKKLE